MKNFYYLIFLFLASGSAVAQTQLAQAQNLYDAKNFAASKAILEKLYDADHSDTAALELLANIEGIEKHWSVAIPLFKELTSRKPYDAEVFYRYGGVMARQAQQSSKLKAMTMLNDIESAFQKTIQLEPNHINARWALIEYYIQVPKFLGGGEDKAKRYADELAKLSAVDGCLAKGHIEEFYGRFSQAEIFYLAAIKVGNSKTGYQKLADLYRNKMDRPNKADAILRDYQNQKI